MTPDHRREIDGLRALAVGSVIPFHAGLPLFAGGYVGVDVFFVISGYLMARIVLGELATGNFRLASFYARRARRILPALLMVMLVCLPFAWAWMMPDDLKRFSKSLVAGTLMGSNLLFWLESGYFNTINEFKPLIHTWSLSLEAQYYLLFPLAVLAAWHTCRAWMPTLLAAAGLTSFALALWCNLEPSWQNAGF